MYLIKNIYFNQRTNDLKVENGIRIQIFGKVKTIVRKMFWGTTEVCLDKCADFTKLPNINGLYHLLSYANEYKVTDIGEGFKDFFFHVGIYEPDEIEGYIVFAGQASEEIKTDGEKIFGIYPNEIVVVLKNGNYLEINGRRIEVINNQLMLII